MVHLLRLVGLALVLANITPGESQLGQQCIIPNIKLGRCVPINECVEIAELSAKSMLFEEEVEKLKMVARPCAGIANTFGSIVCCETTHPTLTSPRPITSTTTAAKALRVHVPLDLRDVLPAECGSIRPKYNMWGGIEDEESIHVWAVYIDIQLTKTKGRCAGTLIHERFVLTAAHCVHFLEPEKIKLYFGVFSISNLTQCLADSVCQERRAENFIVHQDYNDRSRINDIALIKLNEAVNFTEDVRPACLPIDYRFDESLPDHEHVLSVGWGVTEHGTLSDSKRIVLLNVIGQDRCRENLREWSQFNMSMIYSVMCTLGVQPGHDVCFGDSGAPLLQFRNGQYYVVGVISHGIECGNDLTSPSVASRLSEYTSWILNKLKRLVGYKTEWFVESVPSVHNDLTNVLPTDCGRTLVKPLIWNGVPDDDNIHVWTVLLEIQFPRASGRCGGTLIHERFVLTAAHCVPTLESVIIKLYFGLVLRSELQQCLTDGVCQERQAAEIIVHPEFKPQVRSNDIALIRLDEPVNFTDEVGPACLPLDYQQFEESSANDMRVWSSGWGEYENGTLSDSKRIVQLNVIEQKQCEDQLRSWGRFNMSMSDSVMCTVGFLPGQDVCNGDGGSSILQFRNKKYHAVGVVSFGPKCGMNTSDANVSTRVFEYLDWILDILRNMKLP